MDERTTQERWEKLILHRDLIIQEANLKGAEIPLNADYPEIILGLQRITLGLPEAEVEALLDEILGETIVGDYSVKGQAVLDEKEAIRQAILAKDVAVPAETPLSQYPAKIAAIETGGGSEQWEIPSDWEDLSLVGDNEIILMVSGGENLGIKIRLNDTSKVFNVTWGDGTNNDYVGNGSTIVTHAYTTGTGTILSDGVEVWYVHITSVYNITKFNFARPASTFYYLNIPVIAAAFGGQYIDSFFETFYGSNAFYCYQLRYVFIKSMQSCTGSIARMFYRCESLKRVDFPASFAGVNNASSMFERCSSLETMKLPNDWGSVTSAAYMFRYCYALRSVELPISWGRVNTIDGMFSYCYALRSVELPISWDAIYSAVEFLYYCKSLTDINLPNDWGGMQFVNRLFGGCSSLASINLPVSWGSISQAGDMFVNCTSLQTITIPSWGGYLTSVVQMFAGCKALRTVTLPASFSPAASLNATYMFYTCHSLREINNLEFLGCNNSSISIESTFYGIYLLSGIVTFGGNLKKLELYSESSANRLRVTGVRLTNAMSIFEGSSPQIDVRYCSLDADALNLLFSDLPALTGKTIRITGNPGASTCDTTIATNKGWTVTT